MGMRFQAIIRAVAGVGIGLILAGCAEDIGVDQYGRKVAVERLEGQWLVINYWAQWCAPCRTEIPELNALETQLKAQSVQVLGVPDPPELDPPVLPLDPELEEPELLDDPEFDPLGLLLDPRLEDELELDEVEPEPLLDWLRWAWAWAAAAASASACLVAL